jgi:hypothetical protein
LEQAIESDIGSPIWTRLLLETPERLGDTMLVLINDFLDNYERPLSLYYPYPEFSLVEVPLQFASLTHSWTSTMAQSQHKWCFSRVGFWSEPVDFQSNIFQQQRRQR